MKKYLCPLLVALFVSACGRLIEEDQKIDGIERIFMHETKKYSILRKSESGDYQLTTYEFANVPTFREDIGSNESMSLTFTKFDESYGEDGEILDPVFHIRSVRSVEGGYWDHGKFGSGQTIPIK